MNTNIVKDLEEIKLRMEAFFGPDGDPPEDTGEFRELKGAIKMMEYVLRSLDESSHEATEPLAKKPDWLTGKEPLAVLADRKGVRKITTRIDAYLRDSWSIDIWCNGRMFQFFAPTYAECEAKARAYLGELDNVKGG